MKCPRCSNFCEKLEREYKRRWRECWYCVHCEAIYTITLGKCRKCGGLVFSTRRLREGDKIVNGKFYFGSLGEPYVERKKGKLQQ